MRPVDGTVTSPDQAREEALADARQVIALSPDLDHRPGWMTGEVRLAMRVLWLDWYLCGGGPLPTAWTAAADRDQGPAETVTLPGDQRHAAHQPTGTPARCVTDGQPWPCEVITLAGELAAAQVRRRWIDSHRGILLAALEEAARAAGPSPADIAACLHCAQDGTCPGHAQQARAAAAYQETARSMP